MNKKSKSKCRICGEVRVRSEQEIRESLKEALADLTHENAIHNCHYLLGRTQARVELVLQALDQVCPICGLQAENQKGAKS